MQKKYLSCVPSVVGKIHSLGFVQQDKPHHHLCCTESYLYSKWRANNKAEKAGFFARQLNTCVIKLIFACLVLDCCILETICVFSSPGLLGPAPTIPMSPLMDVSVQVGLLTIMVLHMRETGTYNGQVGDTVGRWLLQWASG